MQTHFPKIYSFCPITLTAPEVGPGGPTYGPAGAFVFFFVFLCDLLKYRCLTNSLIAFVYFSRINCIRSYSAEPPYEEAPFYFHGANQLHEPYIPEVSSGGL